jgi:hypothetical protein
MLRHTYLLFLRLAILVYGTLYVLKCFTSRDIFNSSSWSLFRLFNILCFKFPVISNSRPLLNCGAGMLHVSSVKLYITRS